MNEQFHVAASSPVNLHRPLARGTNLNHVLCYQEQRVVQNDWKVSWCNRILQWGAEHQKLSPAKKTILVSELLDGSLRLTLGPRVLSWTEVSARPSKPKPKSTTLTPGKPPLQAPSKPSLASLKTTGYQANLRPRTPGHECDTSNLVNPVTFSSWSDRVIAGLAAVGSLAYGSVLLLQETRIAVQVITERAATVHARAESSSH